MSLFLYFNAIVLWICYKCKCNTATNTKIIKIWVFWVDPIYCRSIDPAERVRYMTCRLTSDISTKEFQHYYPPTHHRVFYCAPTHPCLEEISQKNVFCRLIFSCPSSSRPTLVTVLAYWLCWIQSLLDQTEILDGRRWEWAEMMKEEKLCSLSTWEASSVTQRGSGRVIIAAQLGIDPAQ